MAWSKWSFRFSHFGHYHKGWLGWLPLYHSWNGPNLLRSREPADLQMSALCHVGPARAWRSELGKPGEVGVGVDMWGNRCCLSTGHSVSEVLLEHLADSCWFSVDIFFMFGFSLVKWISLCGHGSLHFTCAPDLWMVWTRAQPRLNP